MSKMKAGQLSREVLLLIAMLFGGICCVTTVAEDLEGYWRLNEGTGSTVYDDSGNGNDGTIYGAQWVTGKLGKALYFDGIDDYVNLGNDTSLDIQETMSWSFWINLDCDRNNVVLSRGVYNNSGYQITINYGQVKFRTYHSGGMVDSYTVWGTVGSGNWHHVVISLESGLVKFYIDGVESSYVKNVHNVTPSGTKYAYLGAYSGLSYFMDGSIDELKIYDRNLSAEEVEKLYEAGHICGFWKMDNGTGTTASDSSEYSNDGTIYGATWIDGQLDQDGIFGKALSFDGVDDYVSLGNDDSLDIQENMSWTFRVKQNSTGSNRRVFERGVYNSDGYEIMIDYGQVKFRTYHDGGIVQTNSTAGIIGTDTWRHVAIVLENSIATIYVDGKECTLTQNTHNVTPSGTENAYIGGYNGVSYFIDASIDEFKVHDRALSSDEVATTNLVSAYANRNYYTGETGKAICSLNISSIGDVSSNCYLVAKNSAGTELGSHVTPALKAEVPFSTSSMSSGQNTVVVELRKNSEELVAQYDFDILKKAANSGLEIKVDIPSGAVLYNGTKFFPIGFYMTNVNSDNTTAFQDVANAGFNTVLRCNGYNVDPSDATTYLENTDDYDLFLIDKLQCYAVDNFNDYKLGSAEDFWDEYIEERSRILQAVGYAEQEENLLCYYTFDEPTTPMIEAGQDLYEETNNEDGYHPTFALYSSNIPAGDEYTNWCDILGVDTYWIPPRESGTVRSCVDWMTKYTYLAKQRAQLDGKVFWVVPMGEFWSQSNKRSVLSSEQRCQTYLALIHGAKGIIYYRYPVFHDSLWSILSDLAGELADLSGCMLEEDLDQSVSYWNGSSPVLFNPVYNQFTDIQVSLRKAPSGESYDYVLLAANTREYSIDVDYTISLLGTSGTVGRMFDEDTYTVANGEFSDTLDAFATRAYTFSSTSTDPIEIKVVMSPNGSFTPETFYPLSGRENMTNLMQNPSLEDASLTNWPDYCKPWDATPRINAANQGWGLVTDSPYHGGKCLKIVRDSTLNGFYFTLIPQHSDSNGKDYTFSVYLKTDAAGAAANNGQGLSVRLQGTADGIGYTDVYVDSTSWTRKSFTFNVPANLSSNKFQVILLEDGTIWADAVQVEQASSVSAFTTD